MKKILLMFFLMGINLLSLYAVELPKEINIAVIDNDFIPYSYKQGTEYKGLYIDIMKELSKEMKIKINFQPFPSARALAMIKEGKIDGMYGIFKTEEYQKVFYYVDEPLVFEESSLFVKKGSNIKYDGKLSSIAGYNIGIIRGNSFGDEWNKNLTSYKKLIEVGQYEQMIKMLNLNRLDIIVGNKMSIQYEAMNLKLFKEIKDLDPSIQYQAGYLVFSKMKGEGYKQFAEECAKTLKKIKAGDKYLEIIDTYLDVIVKASF